MENRYYSAVSVCSAIILIPQILFWWLAPAEASARLIVYLFSTILTAGIPIVCLVTYLKRNLRMTAGLFIVAGILYVFSIAVSALLLSNNSSTKTAVYSYILTMLVYLIILVPMVNSILHSHRIGVHTTDIVNACEDILTQETDRSKSSMVSMERIKPIAEHDLSCNPGTKPMPPRNR